jgi:hypothetical protein
MRAASTAEHQKLRAPGSWHPGAQKQQGEAQDGEAAAFHGGSFLIDRTGIIYEKMNMIE